MKNGLGEILIQFMVALYLDAGREQSFFLIDVPRCCKELNRLSEHIDHIERITGPSDPHFRDPTDHRSLGGSCHSSKTNREDGGSGREADTGRRGQVRSRSNRPCPTPGCPNLVVKDGKCRSCRAKYDKRIGTAHQRGYTSRWAAYSRRYRQEHPVCVKCGALSGSRARTIRGSGTRRTTRHSAARATPARRTGKTAGLGRARRELTGQPTSYTKVCAFWPVPPGVRSVN